MLIVSNSAGTKHDAGQVQVRSSKWGDTDAQTISQAESVSYHLSVPVLRHNSPKPAYSCIKSIRGYFSTLRVPIRDEELVVVGDRIFTDVVMANRMRRADVEKETPMGNGGPLAVWTSGVWQRESMVVRWWEKRVVDMVTRWTDRESGFQDAFAKPEPVDPQGDRTVFSRVLGFVRRT